MRVREIIKRVDELREEISELTENMDDLDHGTRGHEILHKYREEAKQKLEQLLSTDVAIVDHTSESHPNG